MELDDLDVNKFYARSRKKVQESTTEISKSLREQLKLERKKRKGKPRGDRFVFILAHDEEDLRINIDIPTKTRAPAKSGRNRHRSQETRQYCEHVTHGLHGLLEAKKVLPKQYSLKLLIMFLCSC